MKIYETPIAMMLCVNSEDICTLSFNENIVGTVAEFDFQSIFNIE